jgi:hypothetical protein
MTPSASDEPIAVLPWVDREVTRVAFDHQLRLLFDDGGELVVETPLTLTPAARVHTVVPGEPAALAPALMLLWRTVTSAVVDVDRALVVTFADGTVLWVPVGVDYEAWNATGPGWNGRGVGNWMVVSMPSGRLAVWGEDPEGGRFPADAI